MAVPKLRFKANDGSEFPDWEHFTVGELFSLVKNINTGGYNKNVITNSAEYGLIPQRSFFDKDIAVAENTDKYTVIEKGDFVYNPRKSSSAPFGPFNCYAEEQDGIVSPLYFCLRPKRSETTSYLLYYFASPAWHRYIYNNGSQGGARHDRVGMTNSLLLNMPVSLPCAEEQHKIYDNLSTLNIVIKNCQSEVDAWEKYKRGVMQQLFSQNVRFKADDGSEYPKWEEKTLGELGEFFKGAPLSKADISEEGLPIILYGELYTTYEEVTNDIKKHTKADVSNRYLSKMGDVVIPTSGETPEEISTATCVMKDNVVLAGDLYIYRTSNALDGRLMSYLLNHQINNDIARIAQGKSIVHVHAKEICKLVVQYPSSISEQQKIVDCLSAFDEVIDKAKQKLEAYKQLKKGLLQQMFV